MRRRSKGHPNNFGVRLDFQGALVSGHYAFEISARQSAALAIKHEDADDDCPAQLGHRLLATAQAADPRLRIAVVLAVREFETWFLAAVESIAGKRGLAGSLTCPPSSESIRDAKGWLTRQMDRRYSPTLDQPAFSAGIDLEAAQNRSASFAKLVRDVSVWLDGSPGP